MPLTGERAPTFRAEMATGKSGSRRDSSIKDLLTRTQGGKKTVLVSHASLATNDAAPLLATQDAAEAPITCSFLEGLFSFLRTDLNSLRDEIHTEIKGLQKDITDLGNSVNS